MGGGPPGCSAQASRPRRGGRNHRACALRPSICFGVAGAAIPAPPAAPGTQGPLPAPGCPRTERPGLLGPLGPNPRRDGRERRARDAGRRPGRARLRRAAGGCSRLHDGQPSRRLVTLRVANGRTGSLDCSIQRLLVQNTWQKNKLGSLVQISRLRDTKM